MPLAKEFLRAMKAPILSWLDSDDKDDWYLAADNLPICNNLFLELHTNSNESRCDIITSLAYSDGTLSEFLNKHNATTSPVWCRTVDFLENWHEQLKGKDGFLKKYIFSVWLEFDLRPEFYNSMDPSIFIALTPFANIDELTKDLKEYPDFQTSLQNSLPFLKGLKKDDPIILGHIGYMAPRQNKKQSLFLRSCWRCNSVSHFLELLNESRIVFNYDILCNQIKWMYEIEGDINSYLLDLDSNETGYSSEFCLELNVYNSLSPHKENLLLRKMEELGFVSSKQKQSFKKFSGNYILNSKKPFNSTLHHIKLKFIDSQIAEIKCYWRVSLKPRLW